MALSSANTLRPYTGSFGPAEAKHLLRRATIGGATRANVERSVDLGLAATVDELLKPYTLGEPVTHVDDHPDLALGQSWIGVPEREDVAEGWRRPSLHAWVVDTYLSSGFSVHGRMWFFWINHFGVDTTSPPHEGYAYYAKLHEHVTGNFRDLIADVTVNWKMLRFLNGNRNSVSAPNENFARELLELFTVGKGPQRAEGDYTNYTEDDVREFARALTGWKVRGAYTPDGTPQSTTYFSARHHDTGDKQLSAAFGDAIITDGGESEYLTVVDTILAQPRSLDYLCRKFYRWFIDYDIDATDEETVVRPLADAMRATGFDIRATLRLLLQSEAFFDPAHRGALAKSPVDFVADMLLGFGGDIPARSDVKRRYGLMNSAKGELKAQGIDVEIPDSVAGYKPFHQEPKFNRYWINSGSLNNRSRFADKLISRQGLPLGQGVQPRFKLDLLGYIDTFANPYDPNDLIAELADRHLPLPMPYEQISVLKQYLIPDLPDWEWTVEYGLYRSDPDDEGQRSAVASRVQDVWRAMCDAAEFAFY